MNCVKCNHQNDALSVKCINCGNDLTQKSIKNTEAEINHYFARSAIFWGSIVFSVWIFQSYKYMFFETYFDRMNWYEVAGATVFGGFCAYVGKKIGDYLFKER